MRRIITIIALALASVAAHAQVLSVPPSGDNQKASVTQSIGLVKVSIDYSSPDVHAPDGTDRRGKIWGQLVPWGTINDDYGTCDVCPWRAGANENTVFTVSHDVRVEGQSLPAGRYGLFMIPQQDEWTIIFSKNADSWGHYYYDVKEDALRVKVKPSKAEYNEWLTYEFTDRRPDKATVALKWEELQVPFTISVDDPTSLHIAQIRNELRNDYGFYWMNWMQAAQYAIGAKRADDALYFAQEAVSRPFMGQENFQTLNTLAMAQDLAGKNADAAATRERAINHRTAGPGEIHQYGRMLLTQGKKQDAVRVWELNAKRFPNTWPVHVGLARGYSAVGRYKDALKHAKLALAQAPDEINRTSLSEGIKKLEKGQDWN